jgi:hypothetical protein
MDPERDQAPGDREGVRGCDVPWQNGQLFGRSPLGPSALAPAVRAKGPYCAYAPLHPPKRHASVSLVPMSDELKILIDAVRARPPMTAAEREEQLRGFVVGYIGLENERVTRDVVDQAARRSSP